MFQTKFVEKIKTHILCSITFFQKSWRFLNNVKKFSTARQATDCDTMQAFYMLDVKGYRHKLRI